MQISLSEALGQRLLDSVQTIAKNNHNASSMMFSVLIQIRHLKLRD
jgi:hypothetical protein